MRAARRAGALCALALATVPAAAGCGETVIDTAETEALVEEDLARATDRKVTSVECPSEVKVEKGATFECTVTFAGGERETATLKILSEDADLALSQLRPSE